MGVTTTTRPARRRNVRPTVVRLPAPERVRSCALAPEERTLDFSERPVQLTKRGRLVLALGVAVVAAVLIALAGLGALKIAPAADAAVPERTATVMVEPGQTLWQIAKQATPGGDVRATVDQIMRLNGIKDAGAVEAGTELRVPLSR